MARKTKKVKSVDKTKKTGANSKKGSWVMKLLEAAFILGTIAGILIKVFKGSKKKK